LCCDRRYHHVACTVSCCKSLACCSDLLRRRRQLPLCRIQTPPNPQPTVSSCTHAPSCWFFFGFASVRSRAGTAHAVPGWRAGDLLFLRLKNVHCCLRVVSPSFAACTSQCLQLRSSLCAPSPVDCLVISWIGFHRADVLAAALWRCARGLLLAASCCTLSGSGVSSRADTAFHFLRTGGAAQLRVGESAHPTDELPVRWLFAFPGLYSVVRPFAVLAREAA
jgi:hypothetical protein